MHCATILSLQNPNNPLLAIPIFRPALLAVLLNTRPALLAVLLNTRPALLAVLLNTISPLVILSNPNLANLDFFFVSGLEVSKT